MAKIKTIYQNRKEDLKQVETALITPTMHLCNTITLMIV